MFRKNRKAVHSKVIKVGTKGPTLHVGAKKSRVGSGFCDIIGEFLYEVCCAALYKFGSYSEDEFGVAVWGDYVTVHRCLNREVKEYAHHYVRVARTALKQNLLLAFEVSIVDALDFPIITITVRFRKRPKFRDSPLWRFKKEYQQLVKNLSNIIRNIQRIPISEEQMGFIYQTDEKFKEIAEELDMEVDSGLPQSYHTNFVAIGDPVTNLFNQLHFDAIFTHPPSKNENDMRWTIGL